MAEGGLLAAREMASGLDPAEAAERCGFTYSGTAQSGVLGVPFLSAMVEVEWPGLACVEADALPSHVLAIIVYHLAIADGSPPSGRWI